MIEEIVETYPVVTTGLGGAIGFLFFKNETLKKGLTNIILSSLGQFGSKKINLKNHKAFISLRNYKNQLSLYIIADYVKAMYYKRMASLMCDNITLMFDNIVNSFYEKKYKTEGGMDIIALREFEECKTRTEEAIRNLLVTPPSVILHILQWREMMWVCLKSTLEDILYSVKEDSPYVQTYKILDCGMIYINYLTATGSNMFSRINGAFSNLKEEDIYKEKK